MNVALPFSIPATTFIGKWKFHCVNSHFPIGESGAKKNIDVTVWVIIIVTNVEIEIVFRYSIRNIKIKY